MKYIASIFLIFVSLFSWNTCTFAYTPTGEDDMFLQAVEKKIDAMFPVKINKLEYIYHRLDSKIHLFELRRNEQFVYLLKNIQKMLRDKVFAQDEVCIATYAQVGDTVEITYNIKEENGTLLREQKTPIVFNPTIPKLRKNLSYGVLGMKTGERKFVKVPSFSVKGDDKHKDLKVKKNRKEIESGFDQELALGDTLVFGSTKIEGVVMAKIVALDDEQITFDFSISGPGHPIYLTLKTEQVNKFCGR